MDLPPVEPITYQMLEEVSQITQTPVLGLYLILQVEGGTTGECVPRKYNSDCGPFQVNTMHFDELHSEFGLTRHNIVSSTKGNALAAGAILNRKLKICIKRNYDWFGRIACYHNFNAPHRDRYRKRLIEHAKLILTDEQLARYFVK
ncbi:hypothetical protein [Marinobacterium stanieri]|uniref:Transglycosylase SLT domain-containing protein n=1 Tax=Marinobacterium stanieri TaxID=49186 RepID=A0A1N6X9W1_9GAMM|nr:hypothetical protein [Marinobacterium stanieri]SIQ99135.1 hypothetical protein SAMN05421647_11339 [Marinobacterium stanieri]